MVPADVWRKYTAAPRVASTNLEARWICRGPDPAPAGQARRGPAGGPADFGREPAHSTWVIAGQERERTLAALTTATPPRMTPVPIAILQSSLSPSTREP